MDETNDKHQAYTGYNRKYKSTRRFREYPCLMYKNDFVTVDYGGIIINWSKKEYAKLIGIKSGIETLS